MQRRHFIAGLGAATICWPIATRAQPPPKIPRIGIIDDAPIWNSFRRGLRDLGYHEGQNIAFEYRYGDGAPERLAEAAAALVRRPVDLIATFGTPPTRAAKQATATIPIVMIGIGDPVRAQLVASLAQPGGNITGNTILGPDLSPKRLQLLKEVIPSVLRLAFLWNRNNASNVAILEELQVAAPAAGITLISVELHDATDFDSAFAAMMRERPDAFLMTNDPFHLLQLARIIEFLTQKRVPGLFQAREHVVAGGFMSYGASLPDLFQRGALYAHKIMQGAKPAELPVEQPTKFELAVNLRTAKTLGIAISESFLLRVDEVIE
jgi:putative tryptophan/tyrosine transport system substrate-binding protein